VTIDPPTFRAWHAAHERATHAEQAVFQAAIAYTSSAGPEPSPEDFQRASALRAEANSLFRATMAGISRQAEALRWVNVRTCQGAPDGRRLPHAPAAGATAPRQRS
jgi:hypothetical protein